MMLYVVFVLLFLTQIISTPICVDNPALILNERRRHSFPSGFLTSSFRFITSGFSSRNSSKRLKFKTKSGDMSKFHEFVPSLFFAKKAVPNCNCEDNRMMEGMKEFIFKSDISKKELTVKVAINEGHFAEGKWAKLYNGCFKTKKEGQNYDEWKCVGVKLVGRGTFQYTNINEFDKMNADEKICEDPENEVKNLQKIKNTFKHLNKSKHIIKLYDGGEIFYENNEDMTYGKYYKYAVILELGKNNYLDAFIKKFVNKSAEIDEEEIMQFLAEAIEPFIDLHKILVYMDLKPQNLVYVKEIINNEEVEILKVIDFGGVKFFQKKQQNSKDSSKKHHDLIKLENAKLTSTYSIMPPEMDLIHHHNINKYNDEVMNFKLTATTKSDMWAFGILIYNLLLVLEYPEKNQTEISSFLDIINKIYKFGNEAKTFEDIHKFIDKMDFFPIKENDEILAYAHILNIRFKYPRLFMLITNLLDKNPAKRLLAQQGFDYLKMKCKMKIKVEKREENLNWIKPEYAVTINQFIGKITIKMLRKSEYLKNMASKYNLNMEFSDESFKKMIEKDEDKFKKITQICGQS